MTFNRNTWLEWKNAKPCPSCNKGLLFATDTYIQKETNASIEDTEFNDGDYEAFVFTWHLECSNCKDTVVVAGRRFTYPRSGEEDSIIPVSFLPAPPIIGIPISCSTTVKYALQDSFRLYWSDIGSCANKIRTSIEFLLNELGVRKRGVLNDRIKRYIRINDDIGNKLLSIKWIGNAGSHSSDLEKEDLLDAYELLEYCLESLYSDKKERLDEMSQRINDSKSPRSKE